MWAADIWIDSRLALVQIFYVTCVFGRPTTNAERRQRFWATSEGQHTRPSSSETAKVQGESRCSQFPDVTPDSSDGDQEGIGPIHSSTTRGCLIRFVKANGKDAEGTSQLPEAGQRPPSALFSSSLFCFRHRDLSSRKLN